MMPNMQALVSAGVYLTTRQAAEKLSCSPRRIRALLAQGRLTGEKLLDGVWVVNNPLRFTQGSRGPKIGFRPLQPGVSRSDMPQRSAGIKTALAPVGEASKGGFARGRQAILKDHPLPNPSSRVEK
jgi:hypothetical protein